MESTNLLNAVSRFCHSSADNDERVETKDSSSASFTDGPLPAAPYTMACTSLRVVTVCPRRPTKERDRSKRETEDGPLLDFRGVSGSWRELHENSARSWPGLSII